ncbi:hypothetical protein FRB99_004586 [Tulasnella sp. 403]|nr:hypothetical protein FRB99_004586 [Tulasnella sp. 403]
MLSVRIKPAVSKASPRLPWDILIYVVTFIPRTKLLPILFTCHTLRLAAELKLYRHIDLSNCPIRSLYLFRTLLDNDRLASYVLTFQPCDRLSAKEATLQRLIRRIRGRIDLRFASHVAYGNLSEQVMGRLENVETISIHGTSDHFIRTLGSLRNVKKFRTLHPWGLTQHEGLLDALPMVTHLELPFTSLFVPISEIQPDHAKNVEELICPTNVAVKLVPNRPVKRLFLMFPILQAPPSPYEVMAQMARSTASITVLGIMIGYGWQGDLPDVLKAAGLSLPRVEKLYLKFRFLLGESQTLKTFLEELPQNLSRFESLRMIDFNGSIGHGIDYFEHKRLGLSPMYIRILEKWSEGCPHLSKVIFPNGSEWLPAHSDIETLLSAYRARITFMESRLMATLDALDTLQHNRFLDVEETATLKNHLEVKNKALRENLKAALEERDDMRSAVEELAGKVEKLNNCSFLSQSCMSITQLLEPVDAGLDGGQSQPASDSYAPSLVKALTKELAHEREAHVTTRKEAAAEIALLQAQLARREAELQTAIASDMTFVPSDPVVADRFGSPQKKRQQGDASETGMTSHEALLILDQAERQNRRMEAEVKQLEAKLGRLRKSSRPPTSPEHPGSVSIPLRAKAPALDRPMRSPPVSESPDFERILLLEEECLRLRASENSLKAQLFESQAHAARTEAQLRREIASLQQGFQDGGPLPTPKPIAPLELLPGLIAAPSQVSDTDLSAEDPGGNSSPRPQTPTQIHGLAALPSPPSSTRDRPRRAARPILSGVHVADIEQQLLQAMRKLEEKDKALDTLKQELEALRSRIVKDIS